MYDVILADPPWQYRVFNDMTGVVMNGRRKPGGVAFGASLAHYNTMTLTQMKELPVADLANKNCALLMWVTNPLLQEGLDLMKAWGFTYKTVAFNWVKVYRDGRPICGLGHYTRSGTELCLLGIRGKMRREDNNVLQVIETEAPVISAPVRGHSAKPLEQYELIERLFGADKRRLELFARNALPGWDVWGNQISSTPDAAQVLG